MTVGRYLFRIKDRCSEDCPPPYSTAADANRERDALEFRWMWTPRDYPFEDVPGLYRHYSHRAVDAAVAAVRRSWICRMHN